MPNWTSSGNTCVASVWFVKILSVWSVNNIPGKKFLFGADTFNFAVSINDTLLFLQTSAEEKSPKSLTESYAFDSIELN